MQSMTYFRQTYGTQRSVTMFHRLRTWYNKQAKLAANERRTGDYEHYTVLANTLTAYIKAARNVWAR